MLFGLQWYWWLVIGVVLIVSLPVKVQFLKWRDKRRQEKRRRGKWGDGA